MNTLRMVTVIIGVSLAGLTCSSYIPTRYYEIATEFPVERASKPYPFTLEVRNFRSPSRYKDQMVYSTSDFRVGFYEYSQWVEAPAEMVQRAFVNALRESDLFVRVDSIGLISAPDFVLQGSIVSFDQVIDGKGTRADFKIELEIVPGVGGRAVWVYDAKAVIEQDKKGAIGFVPAMVAAVEQAVSDSIKAMENSEELRKLAVEKKEGTPTPTPGPQ